VQIRRAGLARPADRLSEKDQDENDPAPVLLSAAFPKATPVRPLGD
jgi:hypothetical protein